MTPQSEKPQSRGADMPEEIYAYKTSGSNCKHWTEKKSTYCSDHYRYVTKYTRSDLSPAGGGEALDSDALVKKVEDYIRAKRGNPFCTPEQNWGIRTACNAIAALTRQPVEVGVEELLMIAHQDCGAKNIGDCWCEIRKGVIKRLREKFIITRKD